jgi:hypothetical protein
VFAAIVLFITWQNWRTRNWRPVIGRIVESRGAARDVRTTNRQFIDPSNTLRPTLVATDQIDRRNFADIAYEYAVAGQHFVGRRVSMRKDRGNFDVVAVLQRYPKGKPVTVYYDPAAPGESILERDDPRKLREAWLGVVAFAIIMVGGYYGFDAVLAFVTAHARDPRKIPFVMFALATAGLVALMALATVRHVGTMRRWPTADGVVVESRVERALTRYTQGSRQVNTPFYIPRVIYRFTVEGVAIQGDQHGRMTSSTTPAHAEKLVARFPVGARVVVHYDPNEPTTAIVGPTAGLLPLGLAIFAALAFGVAYALATL